MAQSAKDFPIAQNNDFADTESAEAFAVLISPDIEKQQIIDFLKIYEDEKAVLLFAKKNESLRKIIEEDPKLKAEWARRLKAKNYCASSAKSIDGKIESTVMDHFKSAVAYSVKDQKEAIKLGNFYALKDFLNECKEKLHDNTLPPPEMARLFAEAVFSAERIGNLYWSYGYLTAANIFLELYSYLFNKIDVQKKHCEQFFNQATTSVAWKWREKYDAKDIPMCLKFLKKGVEYLYLAEKLAEREMSKQIVAEMLPQGMFMHYKNYFQDWEQAKAYYSRLYKDSVPLLETFCSIAAEKAQERVPATAMLVATVKK